MSSRNNSRKRWVLEFYSRNKVDFFFYKSCKYAHPTTELWHTTEITRWTCKTVAQGCSWLIIWNSKDLLIWYILLSKKGRKSNNSIIIKNKKILLHDKEKPRLTTLTTSTQHHIKLSLFMEKYIHTEWLKTIAFLAYITGFVG
jgi:hypothetical protein